MSKNPIQNSLISIILELLLVHKCVSFKYLVGGNVIQETKDFILSHPLTRQIQYYPERPVYNAPVHKAEYSNSPQLLIGNYAEPLYQPGYRTAQVQSYLATGYEQDYQPSGYQESEPYPGKYYEDSYMPQDSHYGPPKPEPPKPEAAPESTTTMIPVATPCTCHYLNPSQPLPHGAPEDMYLPPEMTLPPITNPPDQISKTDKPEEEASEVTEPPTTRANSYLPAKVEFRTMSTPPAPLMYTYIPPSRGIQGPTPLPDEPGNKDQGYVYPVPNPIFHPETTMVPPETTTPEATTTESPKPKPKAPEQPILQPNFGYQPIFLLPLPLAPQGGYQYYGSLVQPQQSIVAYPPPIVQNGGEGVVITIPSKTYLPPK